VLGVWVCVWGGGEGGQVIWSEAYRHEHSPEFYDQTTCIWQMLFALSWLTAELRIFKIL
jgi:hypothetical protein